MNNKFYLVTDYIQNLFKDNEVVNTIIYARTEENDILKNNVYPMVHINPVTSPWVNRGSNIFSFEIGVLNQRIKDNRGDKEKIDGNQNIIDNHNLTYSIINEFLTAVERDINSHIYLENVSGIEPIFLQAPNSLDGFSFTIELKIENDIE